MRGDGPMGCTISGVGDPPAAPPGHGAHGTAPPYPPPRIEEVSLPPFRFAQPFGPGGGTLPRPPTTLRVAGLRGWGWRALEMRASVCATEAGRRGGVAVEDTSRKGTERAETGDQAEGQGAGDRRQRQGAGTEARDRDRSKSQETRNRSKGQRPETGAKDRSKEQETGAKGQKAVRRWFT